VLIAIRMRNSRGAIVVPYVVDETLREGIERTPFPISVEAKTSLLESSAAAGIREFIVGCGPEVPHVWEQMFALRERGRLPADCEATFIVLLNCWETAFEHFGNPAYSKAAIAETTFSFGMITHKEKDRAFDRAVESFRSLGATKLKASVLNNFRRGFDETKYAEIRRQIDWAVSLGIGIIRINDSVGALHPRLVTEMATRLLADYPDITFCLHAHNDMGLAVANTLAAVDAGFQMVEGSLAGFGNRSGIAPLEQVLNLCLHHGVEVGHHPIDMTKLIHAARRAEQVFLAVPNLYRPVSGIQETVSNFGVLNIPDFLETGDDKDYFVNYPGLHPVTIKRALDRHAPAFAASVDDAELWTVVHALRSEMEGMFDDTVRDYRAMVGHINEFYAKWSYSTQIVSDRAQEILAARVAG
jgi:2-isopropylmalate synthase